MKTLINRSKQLFFKAILFAIGDVLAAFLAIVLGLSLRFNSVQILNTYNDRILLFGAVFSAILIVLYAFQGLYRSLWSYASAEEMVKLVLSSLGAIILLFVINLLIPAKWKLPNGIFAVAFLIQAGFSGFYRFFYRMMRIVKSILKRRVAFNDKTPKIAVIGSGFQAMSAIKGYNEGMQNGVVMAVIDRHHQKGTMINGVMIRGDLDDLEDIIESFNIDDVVIASETFDEDDMAVTLDVCAKTGARLRKYSDMSEVDGLNRVVDIDPKDLLGRPQVNLDEGELSRLLKGKSVLVTGGGGSIGSELVRQMAPFSPAKIVILDIYENYAYLTKLAVQRKHPDIEVIVEVGSIRDIGRVEDIFKKYNPSIVLHAAAHKHVPLMETAPCEAVKNNVLGTYNMAVLSDRHEVERFVLVSTDKAVNPTNVMGASKRMAEIIVTSFNNASATKFSAVRFGNVLGSSGSVIPIFKQQIEEGGPVLVTHPEIRRFFMTIPEACQLVLQAGAISDGGEIFVLDMQKPVKIRELAEKMIKMYGYKLGVDIQIEYTGLRPGEKLYEEILIDENAKRTQHDKIYVESNGHMPMKELKDKMEELKEATRTDCVNERIYELIRQMVPEYKKSDIEAINSLLNGSSNQGVF